MGMLVGGGLGLFIDKSMRAIDDISRTMAEGKIPLSGLKALKNAMPWFS